MVHKTLIGGTVYNITGGMTKIGGTTYNITNGRTKIGGTGYNISFGPDLTFPALMSVAVLDSRLSTPINGRNANSKNTFSLQLPSSRTVGDYYYIFSFCNGYCSFYKICYQGSLILPYETYIANRISGSYGNLYNDQNRRLYYSDSGNSSTEVYGATLVALSFPGYTETQIDNILVNATLTRLAGRNASSTASVYVDGTTLTYPCYLFVAYNNNLAYNKFVSNSSWSPLFSASSYTNSSLLRHNTNNNRILLSTNGTSNQNAYGASIIEVS